MSEPSLVPPYDPAPGKRDSIVVTCVYKDGVEHTEIKFQPWDEIARVVRVHLEDGFHDLREPGDTILVPTDEDVSVHYFAAEQTYEVVHGSCIPPSTTTSTTATSTTVGPTPTTSAPEPTTTLPSSSTTFETATQSSTSMTRLPETGTADIVSSLILGAGMTAAGVFAILKSKRWFG